MRIYKTLLISSILITSGCSVYQAAVQPGPVDLTGITIGTPREVLIAKLGPPAVENRDAAGHKQDYFEYRSGMEELSKSAGSTLCPCRFFYFWLS